MGGVGFAPAVTGRVPAEAGVRAPSALGARRGRRWPRSIAARPKSVLRCRSRARWPRSCGCRSASGSRSSISAGSPYWPGVLLGDLLANDYSTLPLGSAVGQTLGNVLEVVVAVLLLRRLVPRGEPLATVNGLARWSSRSRWASRVSATIGGLAMLGGGVHHLDALPGVWRTWWLGDFCRRVDRAAARDRLVGRVARLGVALLARAGGGAHRGRRAERARPAQRRHARPTSSSRR